MTAPVGTELPGLYMLPLPTPFAIGRINAYLARGEGLTLIDTGVNSDRSYAALAAGLAALDVRPADLDRIIITHHHVDHLGAVARLVAESGAAVWCHPACVPYLETPQAARAHMREWSVQLWQEGGAPPDLLDMTGQLFTWFDSLSNAPVAVTGTLRDEDTLDMLGANWTVLHTPGHAGDLICLYDPARGVLLSSDHLIRDVSSNALVEPPAAGQKRPRRLIEYLAQLQRVAALAPRLAYAGHGPPVTDVPALVAERLAHHQQRAARICEWLDGQTATLYEITCGLFSHVDQGEMFLALSEVLGHLDWLERDGRIERVAAGNDGLTRWQVA